MTSKKDQHKEIHAPDLSRVFKYNDYSLRLNDLVYRATLLRGDVGGKPLVVDGILESVGWREEAGDPIMRGDATFRIPDRRLQPINIHDGHVLRLQVRWFGVYREVWRMRLRNGQDSLSGTMTYELADDLIILQESTDVWRFVKGKKRKRGWRCHEVAQEVARRYRIKLGKIAAGKHWITNISGTMSPLQVLQRAYAIERRATGRRFVFRWRNGRLDILPLQRNPWIAVFGPLLQDATIDREERDEKFATAVTVRASMRAKGSKRKREKIEVHYQNKAAVRREGFVHRVIDGGNVETRGEATKKAKRYIVDHSVRKRRITNLTHVAVPFVRRGDALRVSLPEKGFYGKRGVCFVTGYANELAAGVATGSYDLGFDDPITKQRQDIQDAKERAAKRKKKKSS